MMNAIITYEKNTGKISGIVSATNLDYIEDYKSHIRDDEDYIRVENVNNIHPLTHYIDLEIKTLREKGNSPTEFHTWDYSQKQWIFDPEDAALLIRQKRNTLLQQTDWSQGLDVPENIRTVWAEYRNDLRNISQQEGFPEQVTWPISPEGT